jgi:hypothetical protein
MGSGIVPGHITDEATVRQPGGRVHIQGTAIPLPLFHKTPLFDAKDCDDLPLQVEAVKIVVIHPRQVEESFIGIIGPPANLTMVVQDGAFKRPRLP